MNTCHRQTLPVARDFVTSHCIVLFDTSLSGLIIREEQQPISMWSNVRELTQVLLVNTPCSHLNSNWREQRPSNQNELDSSVTEEVGRVCYTGVPASDLFFVPLYVVVFGLRFKLWAHTLVLSPWIEHSNRITYKESVTPVFEYWSL
jgi:hypothetical protein